MKTIALAAALVALALAVDLTRAEARPAHHTRSCPSAIDINSPQAKIPGFGGYLESCIVHRHMRRLFKRCIVAAGISAAGVAIGGLIGQAAARAIAGGMIGAGAGACINELVN